MVAPENIGLTNVETKATKEMIPFEDIVSMKHIFFTADSKFILFVTKAGFNNVYRVKDGSELCQTSRCRFRLIEASASGSFNTSIAFVDFLSTNIHNFTIKDVIHVVESKLRIF